MEEHKMVSIQNIFKSIQQKLKVPKTPNGNEDVCLTSPGQVTEPCSSVDNVSPSTSQQSRDPAAVPVATSEPVIQQAETPAEVTEQDAAGEGDSPWRYFEVSKQEPSTVLPQETSGALAPSEDIVIKQEKVDTDYESTCQGTHPTRDASMDREQVGREKEASEAGTRNGDTHHDSKMDTVGDVIVDGVSYRDPDDWKLWKPESDSDSSSVASLEVEAAPVYERAVPRTNGEVFPEELPPLETLHISLPEETRVEELGVVTGIVGVLVVIESTADLSQYSPLNDDTVLFFENREPFGVVFEVFGQTTAPFYSVRFNSAEDIQEKGIETGLKVFFVPDPAPQVGDITHFVLVQKLKQIKGSDASWKGNNEPPEDQIEYSDDDEEKRSKAKRRGARRNEGTTESEMRPTDGKKKFRKARGKRRSTAPGTEGASSGSEPGGPEGRESPACAQGRNGTDGHQSANRGRGRGNFGFGRGFRLSEPVFTAPENGPSESRHQWSPWAPPGPQPFRPRFGPPERMWGPGPFSGNLGSGPAGDAEPRLPFPDGPRGGFGGQPRGGFSSIPGNGHFSGARTPFADSCGGGSFPGGPVGPSLLHSPWRPPNGGSGFSFDPSMPPPGPVRPPPPGLDPGRHCPPSFQGQPQFVRYHQGHNWQQ